MPREFHQQITPRPQPSQQEGGRQVKAQVGQGATDALPSYIPEMRDPALDGLIHGLSQFQPSLQNFLQEGQQTEANQASVDRMAGQEKQQDTPAYNKSYFATDGLVKAQQDGTDLIQKYQTDFDKDKGNLEQFLQENSLGRLKGITDEDYIRGYSKGILPALESIRKTHLEYQKSAVTSRVESNAMQMLDNGVRSYITQSQPVPEGYVSSIQDYFGKNLGVSQQRFQELLFETVRKIGDEGHFDAYDMLKHDRPDGSPGLYYDPKWKPEIEKAMAHSYHQAQEMARQDRDRRQNEALYSVFAEEDPKKAQAAYDALKRGHLFTRADDLIKWDRLMLEKVDGKPDARQLENEGNLLAKIYQGGVSFKDVLNANASGDITSGSRKYLLSEIRRVQTENRMAAAQEGKKEEAIFKTTEFKSAEDFLQGMLKPRPKDNMDFTGQGNEFDRAQLAQARLEFYRAVKGKSAEEIQPAVEDIVKRYMKRRTDYSQVQQEAVGKNQIPFRNLQEAIDAARKGLLSVSEFRAYSDYFKAQAAKQ